MTPDNPLVSVIIPTFNSGWCIEAAVRSALGQTFTDCEIIVVDDGSTDDTRRRIEKFNDPRLGYHYQENGGRAVARNSGIALARGEWLAFLDADDIWLPNKLEKQAQAINDYPDIVMIYSKSYSFSDRDMNTGEIRKIPADLIIGDGRPYPSDCLKDFLLARFHVCTSTVAAKRRTVLDLNGFDRQFEVGEDWDLFMRLANQGPIIFIPEPLAAYWLGLYQTHYERGSKYNWHQELLQIAMKNLKLTRLNGVEPTFTRRVLATWEWRCAIVERGIGRAGDAKTHAIRAFENDPAIFDEDEFQRELGEFVVNVTGGIFDVKRIKSALRSLTMDLIPNNLASDRVFTHSLGHCFESGAFRAYKEKKPVLGLLYALSAIFYKPSIFGNLGMWKSGLTALLRRN